MKRYKSVLSIAGSDSSGGAGIQADIKSISACGGYAMTAITAITSQNTTGVLGIHIVPEDVVTEQISAVMEDIGADAVKLGMLPTAGIIKSVARLLVDYKVKNIVLDPVIVSTSGHRLISEEAAEAIVEYILPIATLITPNIPETEYLAGMKIHDEDAFAAAASTLHDKGANAVLIKSGHLNKETLSDCLFYNDKIHRYDYTRIDTLNTHGTGCTLSSAIATYLAMGLDMPLAVKAAEDFIHKAINNGAKYSIGKGHGPVHHFFRLWE